MRRLVRQLCVAPLESRLIRRALFQRRGEHRALEAQLPQLLAAQENAASDHEKQQRYRAYLDTLKKAGQLASVHEQADRVEQMVAELKGLEELAEGEEEELAAMAREEMEDLKMRIKQCEEESVELMCPMEIDDHRNAILEIRAGAGGLEAALFAQDLYSMYEKYAALVGWRFEPMSISDAAEHGGFKEATALLSGEGVFGSLKYETGVHRVQRVPTTETGGRVHTSTATVAIMPEAESVDVDLKNSDIRVDVFRAQGAGGQHVNTTNSAVRLTHIPTGTVVSIQDERNQLQNKAKAMKILQSRIYEQQKQAQEEERAELRRSQIGRGDRSERIRTYNFSQSRTTDHRVNLSLHGIDEMMQGQLLDQILHALRRSNSVQFIRDLATHSGAYFLLSLQHINATVTEPTTLQEPHTTRPEGSAAAKSRAQTPHSTASDRSGSLERNSTKRLKVEATTGSGPQHDTSDESSSPPIKQLRSEAMTDLQRKISMLENRKAELKRELGALQAPPKRPSRGSFHREPSARPAKDTVVIHNEVADFPAISALARYALEYKREKNIQALDKELHEYAEMLDELRDKVSVSIVPHAEPLRAKVCHDYVLEEAQEKARSLWQQLHWKRAAARQLAFECSAYVQQKQDRLMSQVDQIDARRHCVSIASLIRAFWTDIRRLWDIDITIVDTNSLLQSTDRHPSKSKRHTSIKSLSQTSKELLPSDPISGANLTKIPKNVSRVGDLLPYQHVAFDWMKRMHDKHCSVVLADEIGLGKKVTVCAFLMYLKEHSKHKKRHLVVSSRPTLLEWEMEIARWAPSLSVRHVVDSILDVTDETDVLLMTMDELERAQEDVAWILGHKWETMVLDEGYTRQRFYTTAFLQRSNALIAKQRIIIRRDTDPLTDTEAVCLGSALAPEYLRQPTAVSKLKGLVEAATLARAHRDVEAQTRSATWSEIQCRYTSEQERRLDSISHLDRTQRHWKRKAYHIASLPRSIDEWSKVGKLKHLSTQLKNGSGSHAVFVRDSKTSAILSRILDAWGYTAVDMDRILGSHLHDAAAFRAAIHDVIAITHQATTQRRVFLFPLSSCGIGLSLVRPSHVLLYDTQPNPVLHHLLLLRLQSASQATGITTVSSMAYTPASLDKPGVLLMDLESYFAKQCAPSVVAQAAMLDRTDDAASILHVYRHQLGISQRYLEAAGGTLVGRTMHESLLQRAFKLHASIAYTCFCRSQWWTRTLEDMAHSSLHADKALERLEQIQADRHVDAMDVDSEPETEPKHVEVVHTPVASVPSCSFPLFLNLRGSLEGFLQQYGLALGKERKPQPSRRAQQYSTLQTPFTDEYWGLFVAPDALRRVFQRPKIQLPPIRRSKPTKAIKTRVRGKSSKEARLSRSGHAPVTVRIPWAKLPEAIRCRRGTRRLRHRLGTGTSPLFSPVPYDAIPLLAGSSLLKRETTRAYRHIVFFRPHEDAELLRLMQSCGENWVFITQRLNAWPLGSKCLRTEEQVRRRCRELKQLDPEMVYEQPASSLSVIQMLMRDIETQRKESMQALMATGAPKLDASHHRALQRSHRMLSVPTELVGKTLTPRQLVELRMMRGAVGNISSQAFAQQNLSQSIANALTSQSPKRPNETGQKRKKSSTEQGNPVKRQASESMKVSSIELVQMAMKITDPAQQKEAAAIMANKEWTEDRKKSEIEALLARTTTPVKQE